MCYWVGTKKVREEMLRRLQQDPDDEIAQLFYKTFTGQKLMSFREYFVAIGKARPELSVLTRNGVLQFRNMTWGLPWSYTDKKTGKSYTREMINSTCEKAFFIHKETIFKQRCIIPLDGYYEFFHFAGEVYPHFLFPREGLFFAAGVWEDQVDEQTGEISSSFSILTTQPNALAMKLHNNPKAPNGPRMLLLIPEGQILEYLNPAARKEDLVKLFNALPQEQMDAYPTVRFLRKEFSGNLSSDDVRKRVDYPELFFA